MYITDYGKGQVVVVPGDGGAQATIGTGMNHPRGVAVDAAGNIFIAATLGASSTFDGNILANAAITVGAGSTIVGRAISITAAITLPATTINTN